jgi:hypothetical protein
MDPSLLSTTACFTLTPQIFYSKKDSGFLLYWQAQMAGSIQTVEEKDAIPARPLDSCGYDNPYHCKVLVTTFKDLYSFYKQNTEKNSAISLCLLYSMA